MKKKTYLFLILMVLSFKISFSQGLSDEIIKLPGAKYQQNGRILSKSDLLLITKSSPNAYEYMKIAYANKKMGGVLTTVGGVLVAVPVVTHWVGRNPPWFLAVIGGGLIIYSVAHHNAYHGNIRRALEIYNSDRDLSQKRKTEINFSLSQSGLGIQLTNW